MSLSFFAKTNGGSEELWVTDGTVAGTHLVSTFSGGTGFSDNELITIKGRAFFSPVENTDGQELWTSDGTAAGTVLVKDIRPGVANSGPQHLTYVNGTLFFDATDGANGDELWKSDGTAAGTVMVKDIQPGAFSSNPQNLINVNGTLFFVANDGTHGFQLWKSDGTAGGTVSLGPASLSPSSLTNVNGTLFFQGTSASGQELWKSDGTPGGTVQVMDINPGAGSSSPDILANLNGTLYFRADDGTHGEELWRSDGTPGGTFMLKDINPTGSASGNPLLMTNVNGTLFFSANDGVHGTELWKSDGTPGGTVMVTDINVGGSAGPLDLINVNGTLYFFASDGIHGNELWKSDGTPGGTVLVADLNPGAGNSQGVQMANVNGTLEFESSPDFGVTSNLYRSDGTPGGTILLASNVDGNIPIGFSATTFHPNDFNSDGNADILWRNSNGSLADWSMTGGVITGSGFVTANGVVIAPDASYSVAGISDFNGDGNADLLWRNTSGSLIEWLMNGSVIKQSSFVTAGGTPVNPDPSWSFAGAGDFNGDGKSDMLWRNASGEIAEWQMNGTVIAGSGDLNAGGGAVFLGASWSVAGIGDFDGDGKADIIWRNTSTGEVAEWQMNGSTIAGSGDLKAGGVAVVPGPSWSIAGVGDFNGDGKADLLWRDSSSGALVEWLMNGTTIIGSGSVRSGGIAVNPDPSWHVVEIGDFDGNGNSDILWRNDNGSMAEWYMNGTAIAGTATPSSSGAPAAPDATWQTQAKPTNFA